MIAKELFEAWMYGWIFSGCPFVAVEGERLFLVSWHPRRLPLN